MRKGFGGDRRIPLEGKNFGHWNVQEYMGEGKYLAKCVCGITRVLYGNTMSNGSSRPCGCMRGGGKPRRVRATYAVTEKFE